jgi:hypothetical protein
MLLDNGPDKLAFPCLSFPASQFVQISQPDGIVVRFVGLRAQATKEAEWQENTLRCHSNESCFVPDVGQCSDRSAADLSF